MNYESHRTSQYGGFAPATPGFTAFGPEWIFNGAASAAPAILAAESALGSHPCVALSSPQVFSEWSTSTPPVNAFAVIGTNPLNFVSHSKGSLHGGISPSFTSSVTSLACFCGCSHSVKLRWLRPPFTSLWRSHDTGATWEYQGQTVSCCGNRSMPDGSDPLSAVSSTPARR